MYRFVSRVGFEATCPSIVIVAVNLGPIRSRTVSARTCNRACSCQQLASVLPAEIQMLCRAVRVGSVARVNYNIVTKDWANLEALEIQYE